jgi:N-methylhydantoinase A
VFCALGGLVSDLVHDAVRTVQGEALDAARLGEIYSAIEAEGLAWLDRQAHPGQVLATEQARLAEMRYAAQSFTIQIELTEALTADGNAVNEAFHAEHERLFGHANRRAPVAIDTLRVRTMGRQAKPSGEPLPPSGSTEATPLERRRLRFGRAWVEDVPVYDWATLPRGWSANGPAVVQQDLATILVPPGYSVLHGLRGDLELARS